MRVGDLLLGGSGVGVKALMPARAIGFDAVKFGRKNALDFLKQPGGLGFGFVAGVRLEIDFDIVGASPLFLDIGQGPFVFLLDALAGAFARGGESGAGGVGGIDDPAGLDQSVRDMGGARPAAAEAEMVDGPDGGEENEGDAADDGGRNGGKSEKPGARRRSSGIRSDA